MLGPKEIKEIEPNCEVNNADSSPTSVEFWGMLTVTVLSWSCRELKWDVSLNLIKTSH